MADFRPGYLEKSFTELPKQQAKIEDGVAPGEKEIEVKKVKEEKAAK